MSRELRSLNAVTRRHRLRRQSACDEADGASLGVQSARRQPAGLSTAASAVAVPSAIP
jgi:hypothetical protein